MTTFLQWSMAEWPGLMAWLCEGDHGASSLAIVDVVCGIPSRLPLSPPADEADYQRCLQLVRSVPSIVPHLRRMTRRNIAWHRTVERLRAEVSQ